MRRSLAVVFALAACSLPASASSGFSCTAEDKNVAKLVVEGATPRSGGSLINFGAALEVEAGRLIEFRQPDVKGFSWNAIALKVRVARRANNENLEIVIDARRNQNDEDEYIGSYAVRAGKLTRSGKVKCFVE
jgi:hypothetical protein